MPKVYKVLVTTMEAELDFSIQQNTTVKQVFEQTAKTIELRELWYFGLEYKDSYGDRSFMAMDRKVLSHSLSSENPIQLRFRAMYYPEDASTELLQFITKRLFYLQVKESILNDDVYCAPDTAVLLASLACQVKYGDRKTANLSVDQLAREKLLPPRILGQFKISALDWAERIANWWSEHDQMLRDEAMVEYLKVCQELEMYGVTYFAIRNKRNTVLSLGVDSWGINIYDPADKLTPKIGFAWTDLGAIRCSKKKLVLKASGQKTADFVIYTDHERITKRITALCIGNHQLFFRRRLPDTPELEQLKLEANEERQKQLRERQRIQAELEAKKRREEREREEREAAAARAAAAAAATATVQLVVETRDDHKHVHIKADDDKKSDDEDAKKVDITIVKTENAAIVIAHHEQEDHKHEEHDEHREEHDHQQDEQQQYEQVAERIEQIVEAIRERRDSDSKDSSKADSDSDQEKFEHRESEVKHLEVAIVLANLDDSNDERRQSEPLKEALAQAVESNGDENVVEETVTKTDKADSFYAPPQRTFGSVAATNQLEKRFSVDESDGLEIALTPIDLVQSSVDSVPVLQQNLSREAKLRLLRDDLMPARDQSRLMPNDILHIENQRTGRDKFKTLREIRQGNTKKRVEEFECM